MSKNFTTIGKKVIDLQIQALNKVKNSLGKSFNEAIKLIEKCQSKVILCGVGKSGIIASKISATLSSVGVPSFTISASNSSHGDLGSISKKLDYLIVGDLKPTMKKVNQAKDLKIKIILENEWNKISDS